MNPSQTFDSEPLRSFDWNESDRPSYAVVMAVAEEAGSDPAEIDPLHSVLDPGALNSLFDRRGHLVDPAKGCVAFEYQGYRVVLKSHGRGYLYESEDG